MFAVLLTGSRVTNTGSAQGCGRQWPLCNGRFVPDHTFSALIEFTHRAVTGGVGLLVVAFAILLLAAWRDRRPVRWLVPIMLASLVAQALMGAAAVIWPQTAAVLALHAGISLVSFASTALAALYALGAGSGRSPSPVAAGVRIATWGFAAYVYVLVYSGALVRHAEAASSCPGWPLCGTTGGTAEAVAWVLVHRALAAAALLGAAGLWLLYRRAAPARPELARGALWMLATLALQALGGGLLVATRFGTTAEIVHTGLTALPFTAAAYLGMEVLLGLPTGRGREARGPSLRAEGAG